MSNARTTHGDSSTNYKSVFLHSLLLETLCQNGAVSRRAVDVILLENKTDDVPKIIDIEE